MENSEMLHEVELETGKKFQFKKLQIRDYSMAAKAAAREGGDNQFVFQINLQQELLKLLLISCDGKRLSASEKERLDDIMNPEEYAAILEYMGQIMGKSKIVRQELTKSNSSGSK